MPQYKIEQGRAIELASSSKPWVMRVWRDTVLLANGEHEPLFVRCDENGILTVDNIVPDDLTR